MTRTNFKPDGSKQVERRKALRAAQTARNVFDQTKFQDSVNEPIKIICWGAYERWKTNIHSLRSKKYSSSFQIFLNKPVPVTDVKKELKKVFAKYIK